jgi:hypothetical protein
MGKRSAAPTGASQTTAFPANSRYAQVKTATWTAPDGGAVTYLQRRFCPQPGSMPTMRLAQVQDADRLDSVAARTLGDPLQWWRVADANAAMDPADLTDSPGAWLRVPVPQNLPQP